MTWASLSRFDGTSTGYTHTGTTREAVIFPNPGRGTVELFAKLVQASHNIKICCRLSGDGMTGIFCGITGANVLIYSRTMGVDSAAIDTAAHGLVAGEAFTLRVRVFADRIECAVLKTDAVTVQVEADTNLYQNYTYVGFESDVDQAAVLDFGGYGLAAQQGQAAEVFWVIAGGNLYACYDGLSLQLISQAIASPESMIGADYQDGKLYFAGGGRSWVWDVLLRTVTPASADTHPTVKLPGATTTGTTTANLLRVFRARLGYAGMEAENQNIYWSAVAEPLNLDTAELVAGHAIAFGVGRGFVLGEPIVCMERATEHTLLIGCPNSLYRLLGDPGDAAAELVPVSESVGVAGRYAVARTNEGVLAFVSSTGLYVMRGSSDPVNISAQVIAGGIFIDAEDRALYSPVVIRDPLRHGLHIWLTRTDGGGSFWWYDEAVGDYQNGNGGYWEETYPESMQPTCATVWKGQVRFGTRGGKIAHFDDEARNDMGTAIATRCPLSVVSFSPEAADVHIMNAEMVLGDESGDVVMKVFGGATVEDVYNTAKRSLLQRQVIRPFEPNNKLDSRSPAILVELSTTDAGPNWTVEGCSIQYERLHRLTPVRMKPAIPPGVACTPSTVTTTTPETDTTPGGPGGGTRPNNAPGPIDVPTVPPDASEPITEASD